MNHDCVHFLIHFKGEFFMYSVHITIMQSKELVCFFCAINYMKGTILDGIRLGITSQFCHMIPGSYNQGHSQLRKTALHSNGQILSRNV